MWKQWETVREQLEQIGKVKTTDDVPVDCDNLGVTKTNPYFTDFHEDNPLGIYSSVIHKL